MKKELIWRKKNRCGLFFCQNSSCLFR